MRKIIIPKVVMVILALVLLVPASISAVAQTNSTVVTVNEAVSAASYYVQKFSEKESGWVDATLLNPPVTYYSIDNQPVAYEITVLDKKGASAGFMIVSATRDWMPVLERSTGKAPSTYLDAAYSVATDRKLASANEYGQPVIYYFGAFSYFTQFGQKMIADQQMIHLTTPVVAPKPEVQPVLQMDKAKAKAEWDKVYRANILKSTIGFIQPSPRHQSNDVVEISGVPAWYQTTVSNGNCDDGWGYLDYPDCRGQTDDPWDYWDGCGNIAAAMVLGYWNTNGYTNFPDDDESLNDDQHYYTNTDFWGATSIAAIGPGIEGVSQFYGYDFITNTENVTAESLITTEIDAGRPFVLSANFSWTGYAWHGVTVFGYEDSSPLSLKIHNTWDTSNHWISYGNWGEAWITEVTARS